LNNIESKISKLEKEILNIDNDLLNNYENTISQPNFFPNYEKKKNELDSLMEKWEKLTLSLD
jgi:ATP-binding cassette subfamily F protein 3